MVKESKGNFEESWAFGEEDGVVNLKKEKKGGEKVGIG